MPFCEICKNRSTKLFYKIEGYIYYECYNCATLFLYPKPSLKQISSYYRKNFQYSAGEANEKQIRFRAKSILNNLKKLNPEGASLLDIGSGLGYFLDEACKNGFQPAGVEPSKELFTTSIKHLIKVDVENLDFANYFAKNKSKKFDFITIIHTIEHITNPKETLSKALELLKTGGILYIETPNLDSHLFNFEKYKYTFLTPPDHIWLFSHKSFDYILREIKRVQIEKISTYSYPEHFMGVVKSILRKGEFPSHPESIPIKSGQVRNDMKDQKKRLKYLFFDKFLSPLLTPILNWGNKGSILELYINKK